MLTVPCQVYIFSSCTSFFVEATLLFNEYILCSDLNYIKLRLIVRLYTLNCLLTLIRN